MRRALDDATIIVTGAASGIGLATARHLSGRSARLILVDVNGSALDRVDLPGASSG